jgi:hypothetical protein
MFRRRRNVVVTGDVIIEWRLGKSRIKDEPIDPMSFLYDPRTYIQLSTQPSGAVSLGEMIDAALKRSPPLVPHAAVLGPAARHYDKKTIETAFWTSHVLCDQFASKSGKEDDPVTVWRIEKRLGIDRAPRDALRSAPTTVPQDRGDADLVVVEHAKQGFELEQRLWPKSLSHPKPNAWLLIRWSRPGFSARTGSKLWHHIDQHFKGRFAVVVNADHLRYFGMQVSRSLSWERTVEQSFYEVDKIWDADLDSCRHFIVSFPSGAVVITRNDAGSRSAKLIYDPAQIDTSWADDYEGEMMGFTRCLTAGIALEMLGSSNRKMLNGNGIIAGLMASRRLLEVGFVEQGEKHLAGTSLPEGLLFPTQAIAQTLHAVMRARAANGAQKDDTFQVEPIGKTRGWRIIDARLGDEKKALGKAWDVLVTGSEAMHWDFPTLRIERLFVIDPTEMETLRAVRELMINYVESALISKPLSIAVFGPAGSGKSFAIKELAKQLSASRRGRQRIEDVTFNVSQFTSPDSIAGALQRVRDIGLSGKLPLVFWDEFDTDTDTGMKSGSATGATRLPWLRWFLAPMQDGQFQHGETMHNVGRAIFVFAGSTSDTMEQFIETHKENKKDDSGREYRDYKDAAKDAKVADFVSRLKGFVNVRTLNHEGGRISPAITLRRAELLRSFLMNCGGQLIHAVQREPNERLVHRLNIDRGVAIAFLTVSAFFYGARSIEAIVNMSKLSGKRMYDRSSLPPVEQLKLHVDADEFMNIVGRSYAQELEGA